MARCDSEPFPIEAKLYLPGFLRSRATRSATELTPSAGLTASTLGWVTSWVIGSILARIVRQAREQQGVDCEGPADADPEGGTIRRGLRDNVSAEIAADARLVLNDKCAGGVLLLQAVGDQTRHDVRRRSGTEGHYNPYGLCW